MRHFIEILMLASLIVFVSCSDNDENNNNVGNQTEKTDSIQTTGDEDETTQWPTSEEMKKEEYFPIGTRWVEVWDAYQLKVDEDGLPCGRDTVPTYYYVEYVVDENTTDADMPSKHVAVTHHFEPSEIRTNFMLYEPVRTDFFIEEKDGVVYQSDYLIDPYAYRVQAYDFVWDEGKKLYTTHGFYYNNENGTSESTLDMFGTVSKDSVELRQLADGKNYMYMPSANLYRGIGRTDGKLFNIPCEIRITGYVEFEVDAVGLAQFYRNGQLIYENKELMNKVEAQ